MAKLLVVYPDRCAGCRVCELACVAWHNKYFQPSKARIYIAKYEKEGIDIPMVCQQCEDPPCRQACPTGAIKQDTDLRRILVDYETCIGCRSCMQACPFGAVTFDPDIGKVLICDLCDGNPSCVEICPTEAVKYVDERMISSEQRRESALRLAALIQHTVSKGE